MLDLMKEPEPWYGFKFEDKTENRTFLEVMDTLELDPDCMIRRITKSLFDEINEERRLGLPHVKNLPFVNVGQFLLTAGSCQFESGISIYGPFDDLYDAMDYAEQNLGVNYFYQYSDPDSCFSPTDDTELV